MSLDAQILRVLRTAAPGAVSGADLAQQLGISRAAIWARIEELRGLGYDIGASPHHGYCLHTSPDVLHADDVQSRLPTGGVIGRSIQVFHETTSTNDVAEKLARDGVPEGAVVFAESQTKGRGRLGRRWQSASGKGLWFSVLLRPDLRPDAATQITVAAATALARAVATTTACRPEIKWPNDLLIGGRKVAGILTELHAELDHIKSLVLGIGVNVNQEPGDFPLELRESAGSLRLATGQNHHRAELAVAILTELDRDYGRILRGLFNTVAEEWAGWCSTLGHWVAIRLGDRSIRGYAESLDGDGALLVRTEHGRLERVIGGDLTLER